MKLRWVAFADNAEADGLLRPERANTSDSSKMAELWAWAGPCGMDLIATEASAQRAQDPRPVAGDCLPFYSRFKTDGSHGMDVFGQGE